MHRSVLLPMFLVLAPLPGLAVRSTTEVNVNVDLTDAGRKTPRPTREHPAYYFPHVAGYREEGPASAGVKVPPRDLVLHELARTLAANGYLVAGPQTPVPTVLLVFYWGSLNPNIESFGDGQVFINQKQMVALVGGQSVQNLDLFSEREAVLQGAEEDRYFVVISAYDFAAAQQRKKVLLWRAKMSTPSNGVVFADVATALITSGGPLLGRETLKPVWVSQSIEPKTSVNLGEMHVLEYSTPKAGTAATPREP